MNTFENRFFSILGRYLNYGFNDVYKENINKLNSITDEIERLKFLRDRDRELRVEFIDYQKAFYTELLREDEARDFGRECLKKGLIDFGGGSRE